MLLMMRCGPVHNLIGKAQASILQRLGQSNSKEQQNESDNGDAGSEVKGKLVGSTATVEAQRVHLRHF